jgi:outer membrane protein assembly factor BamB
VNRLMTWAVMAGVVVVAGVMAMPVKAGAADMDPGDWPQWRGPARDGVSTETGLLEKWPEGGPPLVWQVKGCGDGVAAVVVLKGRFYILGDKNQGAQLQCFDLATQKQIWSASLGKTFNRGENASPAIDGDALFGTIASGSAYCVGLDGKVRWIVDLRKEFGGGVMNEQYGFAETPLVDGRQVIVNAGGGEGCVVALDRDTGKPIWKTPASAIREATGGAGSDKAAYASFVVSEGGGLRHYVSLVGRGLVGINPKDGKVLWGYNRMAHGEANVPTPSVRGDYVWDSNGYGGGTCCLKLTADGKGGVKAEEVWYLKAEECQNHEGQCALIGDYYYTTHGIYAGVPICIEAKTGKIMWKAQGQVGRGVTGITAVEGKLIMRAESGEVSLMEASPKGYNVISKFLPPQKGDEPNWSHPVVSHGMLFIRKVDTLLCYDLRKH